MKLRSLVALLSSSLLLGSSLALASADVVDPKLPDYVKTSGVSGTMSSIGSDTLNNLMTLWAEEFSKLYPSVKVQVQGQGSSTAPPALTEGTAQFGPMSRKMKDEEMSAFESKHGYKAIGIPVAIDALAVFVNKDNPINELTIQQVDTIFSSTNSCGYLGGDVTTWGAVGLENNAEWASKPFQLFGRNSVSGTYGYFKENALCKGDFKNTVNEQPGSAGVVQAVTASINGIGYSGIGYKTAGVKTVNLAKKEGSPFVEATTENSLNSSYPLSRYLYVYVNKDPNKPLPTQQAEFLKMVLSKAGQQVVIKDGYIALPSDLAQKSIALAGLDK